MDNNLLILTKVARVAILHFLIALISIQVSDARGWNELGTANANSQELYADKIPTIAQGSEGSVLE